MLYRTRTNNLENGIQLIISNSDSKGELAYSLANKINFENNYAGEPKRGPLTNYSDQFVLQNKLVIYSFDKFVVWFF